MLKNWSSHRQLLILAFPMVLANITTPLVGLVDTAVLGRMDSPAILAGASIGALIITQVIWVCGFLRMSTTGLSAQAFGHGDILRQAKVLWQGLMLGLLLGAVLFTFNQTIFTLAIALADIHSSDALRAAREYFASRAWGLPLALANLALIGWMIGRQLTRQVLIVQILGNVLNVVLNLIFVYGFNWQVKGVAFATVIAECCIFFVSLWLCLSHTGFIGPRLLWFNKSGLTTLLSLNSSMFLRNVVLQLCLAFLTLQGARYGITAAAINAIILQFFSLIALGLDGIAYAVEALVGKAEGEKSRIRVKQSILLGVIWSTATALLYAGVFAVGSTTIAALLTSHELVLRALQDYVLIIVLLPIIGHWCFLFDGVAIGLTRAKAMRNTMIFSALIGFFPVWWLLSSQENQALWYAMLAFLACRGIFLGGLLLRDHVFRT